MVPSQIPFCYAKTGTPRNFLNRIKEKRQKIISVEAKNHVTNPKAFMIQTSQQSSLVAQWVKDLTLSLTWLGLLLWHGIDPWTGKSVCCELGLNTKTKPKQKNKQVQSTKTRHEPHQPNKGDAYETHR